MDLTLEFVQQHPNNGIAKIATSIARKKLEVYKTLWKLREDGLIEALNSGKATKYIPVESKII